MDSSRKRAQDYAERLLSRPRGDLQVTLSRGRTGVSLLHEKRVLTHCHNSRVGQLQAVFMAEALGLRLPPDGGRATAEVSTGVLFRALSISSLDLRKPEARRLLRELLDTAAIQRGASADATA